VQTCRRKGVRLVVCGLMHQPLDMARRSGLLAHLAGHLAADLSSGLTLALGEGASSSPQAGLFAGETA
jgi:sulfate permease, SulP family